MGQWDTPVVSAVKAPTTENIMDYRQHRNVTSVIRLSADNSKGMNQYVQLQIV
jgi:hypothetical protein